jgi:hypothetical protein
VAAVDPEALNDLPAAGEVLHLFQDEVTNLTFVGCASAVCGSEHDLISIFAHYHRFLNPRSRFFIVLCDHPESALCVQKLRSIIDQRQLTDEVRVAAGVSRSELKGYYLISHAFLGMAQAPGVHVPAVQAMFFQVPVIAWSASALSGTLGEEALAWDELDPAVLAESVHYCLENPEANELLVNQQCRRYQSTFAPAATRRRFTAAASAAACGVRS